LAGTTELGASARRNVDELNILQINTFHRIRGPAGQLVDATNA
jgi:hypothetical protein